MKKIFKLQLVTSAVTLLLSMTACGNDTQTTTATSQPAAISQSAANPAAMVTAKMLQVLGERPSMVVAAPIPGFQMAVTSQGNFFVSNDGHYMLYGRIFDIENDMDEITNNGLNSFRIDKLKTIAGQAIDYPAVGAEKHKIYVFTDITCGYCRKMHRQIADYQKAGISVHYLAFPRGPEAAVSMQQIWCADDKVKAMDDAKLNDVVANTPCNGKAETVQMQHDLGIQFGVRGTPAMVLADGSLLPGYSDPDKLAALLDQKFPTKP